MAFRSFSEIPVHHTDFNGQTKTGHLTLSGFQSVLSSVVFRTCYTVPAVAFQKNKPAPALPLANRTLPEQAKAAFPATLILRPNPGSGQQ